MYTIIFKSDTLAGKCFDIGLITIIILSVTTVLLIASLQSSRRKITVFLFSVMTIVIIFGSLMYTIEAPANGFTSIPRSIYWAVVTLTTVGYGDLVPKTHLGQAISVIIMVQPSYTAQFQQEFLLLA